MRSPSARVLRNTVNIFVGVSVQDTAGGFQQQYPAIPSQSNVPCSVQYTGYEEVVDDQERVTVLNTYDIIFANPTGLTPRDLIVFVDEAGTTRKLFAEGDPPSEAGRGGTYLMKAVERK